MTLDFYPRLLLFSIPKPLVICSLWADKWMLIHDSIIDQMTCCLISCLVIKKHKKHASRDIKSGGVSNIDDVRALKEMNLYGAIIGKAYYTGAIDLKEAIKEAKDDN